MQSECNNRLYLVSPKWVDWCQVGFASGRSGLLIFVRICAYGTAMVQVGALLSIGLYFLSVALMFRKAR